jgi:hypothetical protein
VPLSGTGAAGEGPVRLAHLVVAEHLVQAAQGLAGFGQHHDAAHGPVDAVGHAHEGRAGLLVLEAQVLGGFVRQRLVAGGVALHEDAGGLVDDEEVVVFEQNFSAFGPDVGTIHAAVAGGDDICTGAGWGP